MLTKNLPEGPMNLYTVSSLMKAALQNVAIHMYNTHVRTTAKGCGLIINCHLLSSLSCTTVFSCFL